MGLLGERSQVSFLTADGIKFAHPLHHLGKSKEDLPLIAIDSFRHMYLFPKYEDMRTPGKVRQFIMDLYSGKLHRGVHYGPDEDQNEEENVIQDTTGHIPRDRDQIFLQTRRVLDALDVKRENLDLECEILDL